MVKMFVIGFLCGWLVSLSSFVLTCWYVRRPRPMKPPEESFPAKAGVFLKEMLGMQNARPEPKRPEVSAIPRSPGSWRRQKATLEREHNSKQKERDLRIAGL